MSTLLEDKRYFRYMDYLIYFYVLEDSYFNP